MSLKPLKITLAVVLAASVLVGVLLWLNLSRLTRKFAQEQIPGLTIGEVDVAWNSVKLTDFRYTSGNSLVVSVAARTVDARPTFLSFLDPEIEVRELAIESPNFRLIKQQRQDEPPGGLPETGPVRPAQAEADFKRVSLVAGSGEIEDRTVSGPPVRLTLEQINVFLDDFRYPVVAGSTGVDASCLIKGQPDGKARLTGWLDAVNQSAELRLEVTNLDLKNLRPYLRDRVHTIENAEGTSDLRLEVAMTNGAYTASGELSLANLQLPAGDHSQSRLTTLLLTQYLKLHGNRVTVPFKLSGDLRKKEHRLDLSALLSGIINQEIGNEALQKKIGLPKDLESLDKDFERLKERAKKLRKLF